MLGSFGDIIFEVSQDRVFTFDNYRRNTKAKFAEHEIISQTPVLEYLHAELETISFAMTFNSALGVDPLDEADLLRDICKTGEANYLIIGECEVGDYAWVIESVSENVLFFDNQGNIIANKVEVSLKEYAGDIDEGDSGDIE